MQARYQIWVVSHRCCRLCSLKALHTISFVVSSLKSHCCREHLPSDDTSKTHRRQHNSSGWWWKPYPVSKQQQRPCMRRILVTVRGRNPYFHRQIEHSTPCAHRQQNPRHKHNSKEPLVRALIRRTRAWSPSFLERPPMAHLRVFLQLQLLECRIAFVTSPSPSRPVHSVETL
jgi:hypothetical protein